MLQSISSHLESCARRRESPVLTVPLLVPLVLSPPPSHSLALAKAKKFVAELSPSYMTARKALRELRAQYDRLYEPSIPRRPEWDTDREHLEMWKNYLVYEQTNPLDIEDPAALQARVMMACKRAMAAMRFFSEIW